MNELSLAEILAIAALTLGPGIALAWRFLASPIAPYRRRIEQLSAAESAYRVLSSLGSEREARRELRQAEIGLLGRVEFNRQVRRHPRPFYWALVAWICLFLGVATAFTPGPVLAGVEITLLLTGIALGAIAGLGFRRLIVAARPGTLQAYRDLCISRRGQRGGARSVDGPSGTVGARR